MIECEPVNGKPGLGHWVAVEYGVVYVEAGHVGQNMVSAAYIGFRDSLRNDSRALDSRYMFLLYALFRLGIGVNPQFLTEATSIPVSEEKGSSRGHRISFLLLSSIDDRVCDGLNI
jgi:hypothetical protein